MSDVTELENWWRERGAEVDTDGPDILHFDARIIQKAVETLLALRAELTTTRQRLAAKLEELDGSGLLVSLRMYRSRGETIKKLESELEELRHKYDVVGQENATEVLCMIWERGLLKAVTERLSDALAEIERLKGAE